jgi:transglutaminase-like putative cysteine protease
MLFCSFSYLYAQNNRISTGIEPNWVTHNSIEYNNSKFNSEAEDGYIDLAFEKQVSLSENSRFFKVAFKILSETGVENRSKISIDFDPSYEQIIFHSIKIIRRSSSINKLDLSKIKSIQQEKELDRFLYNGTLSAVLILDDIRKGDVLEYSYTRKGVNPILNGKYTDMYDVQFSAPICHLFYKLIIPPERQITIKNSKTNIRPLIMNTNGGTIYEWKISNLPAITTEKDSPSWHDSYGMIMVSEYKAWKEVNDWAYSLFDPSASFSPLLQKKITEIKQANKNEEDEILATLHFVQDEIRYMGIEMGEDAHKPHNPNQVLKQRFGDCKDKSYLLCSMLKGLGFIAHPVFLNTNYKKTIADWLPSPTVFDHVAVRLNFNGKFYWLDPTIMYQRGRLNDISFPDYQVGLVITDSTKSLISIPFQEKGEVHVKERFSVPDMTGTATFVVITHYTGSFADNVRSSFHGNSIRELGKTYLEFYKSYFDKISFDSLSFEENEENGMFTTKEYYQLNEFWGTDISIKKAVFEPYVIGSIIVKPKGSDRTTPFELKFPASYHEEIEVQLPEPWTIKEPTDKIEGPGFNFTAKYNSIGSKVFMDYSYKNLRDHIVPEEAAAFLQKMKLVDKAWSYSLTETITDDTVAGTSASMITNNYTLLYTLLAVCVVITMLLRKRR